MADLNHISKFFFLGIGGIGMSAIARYLNAKGYQIAGYDKTETQLTRTLSQEGISIQYTDDTAQLPDWIHADDATLMVIYTPAIPSNAQLFRHFDDGDYHFIKRSEALADITDGHKTIAVAGTHGKTTTSTYVAHILSGEGANVTAFLGGISSNYRSNYVRNEGPGEEVMVVEADEYDRSFLRLNPDISIITSCEPDHLDIYNGYEDVVETYNEFANKLKNGGTLILHEDLKGRFNIREDIKIAYYGFNTGHVIQGLSVKESKYQFDLPSLGLHDLVNGLPGQHNALNATAALIVAQELNHLKNARHSVSNFTGIKRRFEMVYRDERRTYIDDYAHHPSELRAALTTARDLFPDRKLTAIFQPHLFSRTRDFQDGFREELSKVDELILMPIYPAREAPIDGITSEILRPEGSDVQVLNHAQTEAYIKENTPELLLTLGAGNIDLLISPILNIYQSNQPAG